MLTSFWLDPSILILHSNKPLDHWTFQQQAMKQPVVSSEMNYGGIEKKVSLFIGLWFSELVSLLRIY